MTTFLESAVILSPNEQVAPIGRVDGVSPVDEFGYVNELGLGGELGNGSSLPIITAHLMDGELHYHVAANTQATDSHGGSDAQTGAASSAYGGKEGAKETVFPPFNADTFASQTLWLILTFGALYYIISKIAGPRIAGILETRRDRIAADIDAAARMKADADAAEAGYVQALGAARGKAMSIAAETREAINAKIETQRQAAEAEAQTKLDAAEKRINEMKAAALSNVDQIAAETTDVLVSTLLGQAVAAEEISAAVSAAAKR